ncbi:MAG: hypothetical protein RIS35_129 [Pseudomonadota bacterium]
MAFGWLRGGRPHAIDDALWRETLGLFPFVGHLSIADLERLKRLCESFVAKKTVTGASGFEVTPAVRTAIALQACLPALNLGLAGYDDFVEIIVYPDQFLVPRTRVDEAGVVHEAVEALAGEAMDGGPVVLSWADAMPDHGFGETNVVIHEFVHKLDLVDGEADGIPPLPRGERQKWHRSLDAAYEAFCDELDRIEARIPADVDPESAAADAWYAQLPLDPYAATDPAEFFAVSGEAFFTGPARLAAAYPDWYAALARFFAQDPRVHALPEATDA